MNLHDEPNAEAIAKLGKYYKDTRWSEQDGIDQIADYFQLLQNEVTITKGKDAKTLKGLRTGMGGMLIKEDAALLPGLPGLHLNNPKPDDDKTKKHIDELLEPWLHAAWKRSQQSGAVWPRIKRDIRGRGRAWDSILPHPHLWADERIKGAVERLDKASDPEERDSILDSLDRMKADIWPIRWMYVSPRGTWSTFDTEFWLPEVVECRQMRKQDIIDRFGEKALPKEYADDKKCPSSHLIDIYVWANYQWAAVVVAGEEPTLAQQFEHKFRRSPYNVAEGELAPDNDRGIRWLSQIFYATDMLLRLDDAWSEITQLLEENARTPRMVSLNRDTYPPDQMESGRPKKIRIEDGMAKWTDEQIELVPVSVMNPEFNNYLQTLQALVERTQVRPVTQGQLLSGTSQNAFSTAVQIAERELDPTLDALTDHADSIISRLFASVVCLGEKVPAYTDSKGKGLIAPGPDDVEGWGALAATTLDRSIYTDMNLIAATADRMVNSLGVPREIVYQDLLKFADPQRVLRLGREERLDEAAWDQVAIPSAINYLQSGGGPTEAVMAKIQLLLGGASPDLQQFISQVAPELGGQSQPQAVAAANEARTGLNVNNQLPQEMTVA